MKISRMWAMPSCHTFTIKPIKQLLDKYIRLDGLNWIDPFAGYNSPAKTNNDINPKTPTKYHMDAFEFLKQQKVNITLAQFMIHRIVLVS